MVRSLTPVVSVVLFVVFVLQSTASAMWSSRGDGCGPEFWASHLQRWPRPPGRAPFEPRDRFSWAFQVDFGGVTLREALQARDAEGLKGARFRLARAATAALLNAAEPKVAYPLQVTSRSLGGKGVVPSVQRAWTSSDPEVLVALARELEAYNDRGCPLE